MSVESSLSEIDNLLFQLALQTRELTQEKNEIDQQIKVCRSRIAEKRKRIPLLKENLRKIEEEITEKEAIVLQLKTNANSMKVTNNLLFQYELTLKADLENRQSILTRDLEVYERRFASCKETLQSHKQYFYQSPLARKLLALQDENDIIESSIKACDDKITKKQMELDALKNPPASSDPTEQEPVSAVGQLPTIAEVPEESAEESTGENPEEAGEMNNFPDLPFCSPETPSEKMFSLQQDENQKQEEEILMEAQDQETQKDYQEQASVSPAVEDTVETPMLEEESMNEQQANGDKAPLSVPDRAIAGGSNSTFAFNFSPGRSPCQENSEGKSQPFFFSPGPDPATPGFLFGGSLSLDEESSFAFGSNFFNENRSTEAQPASSSNFLFKEPETTQAQPASSSNFLFKEPETSDGFQFSFASKSPPSTGKKRKKEEFAFSFNF